MNAISKALTLRDGMRAAAIVHASPSAQAVYAILIAEAWPRPDRRLWVARISQKQLAARLRVTDRSIRNWLKELEDLQLLTPQPAKRRIVQRYLITPYAHIRDQLAAEAHKYSSPLQDAMNTPEPTFHTGTYVPPAPEPTFRYQRNPGSAGTEAHVLFKGGPS